MVISWESCCLLNERKLLKKYIYKITNTINNKCYIGQTVNYKQRFHTHKSQLRNNNHENKHLQNSWNTYGEDNFKFEVIDYGENYNELEKYYIKEHKSDNNEFGFNIMSGGDLPPVHKGEKHNMAKLTWDDVHEIKRLLKENTPKRTIIERFHLNPSTINRINNGQLWKEEGDVPKQTIMKIIDKLQNTKLKQKEIAQLYGVTRTEVTNINNGYSVNSRIEGITYPIRTK